MGFAGVAGGTLSGSNMSKTHSPRSKTELENPLQAGTCCAAVPIAALPVQRLVARRVHMLTNNE